MELIANLNLGLSSILQSRCVLFRMSSFGCCFRCNVICLCLRVSSSYKISLFYVINMNNNVPFIAVEDGLERTFGEAVTR